MSAEIPWACGPGEVLPKAPEQCRDAMHGRVCTRPKGHDGLHADVLQPDPEDARTDAEALADLEVNELRYTQAQWEARDAAIARVCEERDAARAELVSAVRGLTDERDRALVRAQKADDSARFWEAEAKAWEADWRASGGNPASRPKAEGR